MQRKTISKIIIKKLNEWLETITDEQLRKDVKDNLLLSGGSITSLWLNEQVNDYDIYIKDIEVLKRLALYYTKPHSQIEVLAGCDLNNLLESINLDSDSAYNIAVKNLKENQVKLFFASRNGGMLVEYETDENGVELKPEPYSPVYFSANAISLHNNIQIVTRFTGDNVEIHKNFDFIHATNYFTYKDGLVTNVKALESIMSKTLYYQGSLYPLTSVIRTKKFLKRHWNISAGEYLKMLFQVSELDLKDPLVLEEQLIGIDVAYFTKLIEILRGVDPAKINAEYIASLIDKVFQETEDENE